MNWNIYKLGKQLLCTGTEVQGWGSGWHIWGIGGSENLFRWTKISCEKIKKFSGCIMQSCWPLWCEVSGQVCGLDPNFSCFPHLKIIVLLVSWVPVRTVLSKKQTLCNKTIQRRINIKQDESQLGCVLFGGKHYLLRQMKDTPISDWLGEYFHFKFSISYCYCPFRGWRSKPCSK